MISDNEVWLSLYNDMAVVGCCYVSALRTHVLIMCKDFTDYTHQFCNMRRKKHKCCELL